MTNKKISEKTLFTGTLAVDDYVPFLDDSADEIKRLPMYRVATAQVGGDFGIGTTSTTPSGFQVGLPVSTSARGEDNVRLGVASGIPKIILEDSGQNQVELDNSAGVFRVSLGGSVKVVVNSSGNVGIGTTSPSYRLHIAGDNSSNFAIVKLQNTQASGHSWWLYSGAAGVAGDFGIYDETAAAYRLTIDSNGNVDVPGATTFGGRIGSTWSGFSFGSGWTNLGSGYQNGQVKKVGDLILLSGVVYRNSGSGTLIATLPSGYRPAAGLVLNVFTSSGVGRVDVGTDGSMNLISGSASWVSLCGITFSTL